MMFAEVSKKALDPKGASKLNETLAEIWPQLRTELAPMLMDPDEMAAIIRSAGGPTTATELGLPLPIWRDAMKRARDVRNRFSFLDLVDDAGILNDFIASDPQ
jgi:glycerol-1-phosphate dehydrogenase [NAD(P)+]